MAKVLYLCQTLGIGGAEQMVLTTLKYLNSNEFYATVYCIGEKGEIGREIERLGISVSALNKNICMWNIGIIRDLIQVFKREKPDILHCHLFYANLFGRVAAILTGIPVLIISEHGTYSNFKKFYHHWIDFALSFFTNKIIAVSNSVEKYLLIHTLIPKNKITVIYNAVDFDRFEKIYGKDKNLSKREFGFTDAKFFIGCVANISPWKGQIFLLKAFRYLSDYAPQLELFIIGRRDNLGFQRQLEAYAEENGLSGRVHFWQERRDVPQILNMFDLFVLPSLTEGFGLSVIEAMYMGLPVIATNTESLSEIIENGVDGILVSPGDSRAFSEKILLLFKDAEKRKTIARNARAKVENYFSPKAYAEKLESLYKAELNIAVSRKAS